MNGVWIGELLIIRYVITPTHSMLSAVLGYPIYDSQCKILNLVFGILNMIPQHVVFPKHQYNTDKFLLNSQQQKLEEFNKTIYYPIK